MTEVQELTYWEQTARPARHPIASELPSYADVVVIGAGYTGLAAAHRLARVHGYDTVVVEAATVGAGASGRNAGMVVPHVGKVPLAHRLAVWGPAGATASIDLGTQAVRRLRELIDADRLPVGLAPAAWTVEAATPAAAAALASQAATYQQLGYAHVTFEPPTVTDVTGRHGALTHTGCALLHPLDLARSLADLASRHGVTFVERATVRGLDQAATTVTVTTDKGAVRADKVIFATNAYTSGKLHRRLRGRVARFRGYVIVTAPLTRQQWQSVLAGDDRFATDSRKLVRYWRRLPDGRLLFGGPGAIPEWASHRRGIALTTEDLHRRFPALTTVPIEYAWTGMLAAAWDRMPHVAIIDDVGGYALGYAGTGIALSVTCGEALADLLAGAVATPGITPLQRDLPRFPLWPLLPLYPTAARVGYAFKDRGP